MKARTEFAIVAIFFGMGTTVADAADFTFQVPVNIENTIIWDITVTCTVLENELLDDGRYAAGSMRLIGRGSQSATVVDGDFSGTLTVTVDADTGTIPSLAKSYTCTLAAYWPLQPEVGYQQGVGDIMASSGNFQRVYEERGGRMLVSHTTQVRGRIGQ